MTEIVVKIPEDLHETIINPDKWLTPKRVNALVGAVLHGKVLPKGHGKLIDVDKVDWQAGVFLGYDGEPLPVIHKIATIEMLRDWQDAVVDADKGDAE